MHILVGPETWLHDYDTWATYVDCHSDCKVLLQPWIASIGQVECDMHKCKSVKASSMGDRSHRRSRQAFRRRLSRVLCGRHLQLRRFVLQGGGQRARRLPSRLQYLAPQSEVRNEYGQRRSSLLLEDCWPPPRRRGRHHLHLCRCRGALRDRLRLANSALRP